MDKQEEMYMQIFMRRKEDGGKRIIEMHIIADNQRDESFIVNLTKIVQNGTVAAIVLREQLYLFSHTTKDEAARIENYIVRKVNSGNSTALRKFFAQRLCAKKITTCKGKKLKYGGIVLMRYAKKKKNRLFSFLLSLLFKRKVTKQTRVCKTATT